ncbi:hypothetical protein HOY82DRAFT_578572 [Tuber indicum]|nr:hypothetical protein HOY82DRAFT_578572 [Tuber indicum]
MPLNCFGSCNVFFHDATHPDVALGGFVRNGSITEANFLDILKIILVTETPIRVQERISSDIISGTGVPLRRGVYTIYRPIEVNNEPWVHRLITHCSTRREDRIRNEIRHRDRKYVISGTAAHIFPLRHKSLWIAKNLGRWITDMEDATGSSRINSIQNGFLLQKDVHDPFDQYLVSINPDDGYKVVMFDTDFLGCDSRILDPQLLRWHFRQSVFANVRGEADLMVS